MRYYLYYPLFIFWVLITGITGLICNFIPLTNTLGYEFSLIISLVASLGAGHISCCYPSFTNKLSDKKEKNPSFFNGISPIINLYLNVILHTLPLIIIPLLFSLINGFRIAPCNIAQGLQFYFLMPFVSVLVASSIGLFLGLISPGCKTSSIFWFLFFGANIAHVLHGLYSTPAVFAFGSFFGYYPGVLYDRVIQVDTRIVTYRIYSIITAGSLLYLAGCFLDISKMKLRLSKFKPTKIKIIMLLCFILPIAYFNVFAHDLGHKTNRLHLEELLTKQIKSGKLDLYFSANISDETAQSLAQDALFSLHKVEDYFEVNYQKRIAVFFFDSAQQKGLSMGASNTNVAKPWRSEVYVISNAIPHRVLRHELAHIVASQFAKGPFAIAGKLNGIWPNPGLIEGAAVAAQGPRGDLTIHQWASAMKQLALLPSPEKLFGFGFLNTAASTAYTAAGSICRFIHDKYGANALKNLYLGKTFKEATGKPLNVLTAQWHSFLDTIELTPQELSVAKIKFDNPSIISSACVHEVAQLMQQSSNLIQNENFDEAINIIEKAHIKSNKATVTQMFLCKVLFSSGQYKKAFAKSSKILNTNNIGIARESTIREMQTDLNVSNFKLKLAAQSYLSLAKSAGTQLAKRRLYVKYHLAKLKDPLANRAIEALALQHGKNSPVVPLSMIIFSELANKYLDNPVLSYLLARQYFIYKEYRTALIKINETISKIDQFQIPNSILTEIYFIKAITLYHLKQYSKSKQIFKKISVFTSTPKGLRANALDWMDRCDFTKSKLAKSKL